MTKIEPVSRTRISNIEQAAAGIIGNKKVSAARAAVDSEQVLHSLKEHMSYLNTTFSQTTDSPILWSWRPGVSQSCILPSTALYQDQKLSTEKLW